MIDDHIPDSKYGQTWWLHRSQRLPVCRKGDQSPWGCIMVSLPAIGDLLQKDSLSYVYHAK